MYITSFLDFSLFAAIFFCQEKKHFSNEQLKPHLFLSELSLILTNLDFQFEEQLLEDQNRDKPKIFIVVGSVQTKQYVGNC